MFLCDAEFFFFKASFHCPLISHTHKLSTLQMESACVSIHEAMKTVIDYQTHHRLREAQGRSRAEDLNMRVLFWSLGETVALLSISLGQVLLLKSFFTDKRPSTLGFGS